MVSYANNLYLVTLNKFINKILRETKRIKIII